MWTIEFWELHLFCVSESHDWRQGVIIQYECSNNSPEFRLTSSTKYLLQNICTVSCEEGKRGYIFSVGLAA